MILSIRLSNFKECKLWVNEIGDLQYTKTTSAIEETVLTATSITTYINQMALELSLPKNKSNYALTLAKPNDKVYLGISEVYGQSIIDSVVNTLNEIGGYSPGEIRLGFGAYAECGSSKAIFSQTARMLIKLAKLDILNMTEMDISSKIEFMLQSDMHHTTT